MKKNSQIFQLQIFVLCLLSFILWFLSKLFFNKFFREPSLFSSFFQNQKISISKQNWGVPSLLHLILFWVFQNINCLLCFGLLLFFLKALGVDPFCLINIKLEFPFSFSFFDKQNHYLTSQDVMNSSKNLLTFLIPGYGLMIMINFVYLTIWNFAKFVT